MLSSVCARMQGQTVAQTLWSWAAPPQIRVQLGLQPGCFAALRPCPQEITLQGANTRSS